MDKKYLKMLMEKPSYLNVLKDHVKPSCKTNDVVILNEQENKNISVAIIKWFAKNPYPKDEAVHKFAESLGIEHSLLEAKIYGVLSSFLYEGRSKNFKGTYDPKELKMGIKVEMEHTTDPLISEKISKDHLAEIEDYYTRLLKMEKEAGIE